MAKEHSEHLSSISSCITSLYKSLIKMHPQSANNKNILNLFAACRIDDTPMWQTPEDIENEFQNICANILKLPDEYKALITESLWLASAGPGQLGEWAQRGAPMTFVMPRILEALQQGLTIILNETEQDAEFRKFYTLAKDLEHRACKAELGTHWNDPSAPQKPVDMYSRDATTAASKLQKQFTKLAPSFLKVMNYKLRQYTPATFAPDMTPDGENSTEESIRRTIKFNEEARKRAKPYQSGKITIVDLIEKLNTNDYAIMSEYARTISMACDIYYDDAPALATIQLNEDGRVSHINFPEPEDPPLQ